MQLASQQFVTIQSDVQSLRNNNQALRAEIDKLRTNPRTIEMAARARLNMVRSNEYVVPME